MQYVTFEVSQRPTHFRLTKNRKKKEKENLRNIAWNCGLPVKYEKKGALLKRQKDYVISLINASFIHDSVTWEKTDLHKTGG